MKQIYYGGPILTMEKGRYAKAVLVRDGRIMAVGSRVELMILEPDAQLIDLKGKCMMPAFVDAHSHFMGVAAQMLQVNLAGYRKENAYFPYMQRVPAPTANQMVEACEQAQKYYASHGIVSIQEGYLGEELFPIYQRLIHEERLWLDVTGYVPVSFYDDAAGLLPEHVGEYHRHFKLGGVKIFLDGSPQIRTAWMKKPYRGEKKYCGYPVMRNREVKDILTFCVRRQIQLLAHCNGDAACAQFIRCVGKIRKEHRILRKLRPVMIHAQFLQPKQMAKVQKYEIVPSFFVSHVYHWGDLYEKNLGKKRAGRMSPAASAREQGIRFSFHQDAPVVAPDMLEIIWCAVNRRSRGGRRIGKKERLTVWEALKAVTIDAAYQNFEEEFRGSIRPGKQADFVILDRNPLKVETDKLAGIEILGTIRAGEIIYTADETIQLGGTDDLVCQQLEGNTTRV